LYQIFILKYVVCQCYEMYVIIYLVFGKTVSACRLALGLNYSFGFCVAMEKPGAFVFCHWLNAREIFVMRIRQQIVVTFVA